jgi:hypothetical protein
MWYNHPIMTTRSTHRRSSPLALDSPCTVETVEQYLARGGTIQKCAPGSALGASMYTPIIDVDGYQLPVNISMPEYVPNFVRDLSTYDTAQQDPVSIQDDGSAAIIREDEERSMRRNVSWRVKYNTQCAREGADVMEEM